MIKVLLKIAAFLSTWDALIEMLIKFALSYLADIAKAGLTDQGKDGIKIIYVATKTLGMRFAHDTRSTIDDSLVSTIVTECERISKESNFPLPQV